LNNDYFPSGIPFLRIKDLTKYGINIKDMVYFDEEKRKEI
jgi:hypothetical protein